MILTDKNEERDRVFFSKKIPGHFFKFGFSVYTIQATY